MSLLKRTLEKARKEFRDTLYGIVKDAKTVAEKELGTVSKTATDKISKKIGKLQSELLNTSLTVTSEIINARDLIKKNATDVAKELNELRDKGKQLQNEINFKLTSFTTELNMEIKDAVEDIEIRLNEKSQRVKDEIKNLDTKIDLKVKDGYNVFDKHIKDYIRKNAGELVVLIVKSFFVRKK